MPKADATGLAPEKSAEQNPPALSSGAGGFCRLPAASPHFYGGVSERRPWVLNATTARRASKFFAALPAWATRMTTAKLRNSTANSVRISGRKSVTRYNSGPIMAKNSREVFTVRSLPIHSSRVQPRSILIHQGQIFVPFAILNLVHANG